MSSLWSNHLSLPCKIWSSQFCYTDLEKILLKEHCRSLFETMLTGSRKNLRQKKDCLSTFLSTISSICSMYLTDNRNVGALYLTAALRVLRLLWIVSSERIRTWYAIVSKGTTVVADVRETVLLLRSHTAATINWKRLWDYFFTFKGDLLLWQMALIENIRLWGLRKDKDVSKGTTVVADVRETVLLLRSHTAATIKWKRLWDSFFMFKGEKILKQTAWIENLWG